MRKKLVAMLATVLAGAGLGVMPPVAHAAHAAGSPIYNPYISVYDGDDSATIWIATQHTSTGAPVTENGRVVNWILSSAPLTVEGDDVTMARSGHPYSSSAAAITSCSLYSANPGGNPPTWMYKCLYNPYAFPPVNASPMEMRWNVNLAGGADTINMNVDQLASVGGATWGNKNITVVSNSTYSFAFGGSGAWGGTGNDTISVSSPSNIAWAYGGDGNDNLTIAAAGKYVNTYTIGTTTYNDYTTIDGGNGNDVLNANHARDKSFGGNGQDTIDEKDGLGDKIDCGAADNVQDSVYKNSTDSLSHCSSGNDKTNL